MIDPFAVPLGEKVALLADRSRRLLATGVDHVEAGLAVVRENKFYADLAGTSTLQQRVRTAPSFSATTVDADGGGFETMSSLAPPAAEVGSTSPAPGGTGTQSWLGCPGGSPRRLLPRRSNPAGTTW